MISDKTFNAFLDEFDDFKKRNDNAAMKGHAVGISALIRLKKDDMRFHFELERGEPIVPTIRIVAPKNHQLVYITELPDKCSGSAKQCSGLVISDGDPITIKDDPAALYVPRSIELVNITASKMYTIKYIYGGSNKPEWISAWLS